MPAPATEPDRAEGRPFSGAVLVGGASRRMGADKAFLPVAAPPPTAGTTRAGREVRAAGVGIRHLLPTPPEAAARAAGDGRTRPLISVVRDALVGAGAAEVLAVGAAGERAGRFEELGLRAVPDDHPGEGPLGGLLAALDHAAHDPVVALACDLPGATPEAVRTLLAALDGAGPGRAGVIAVAGGHDQPLLGAWHRCVSTALRRAFDAGERSLTRALATVDPVRVDVPAAWAHNLNTPDDLHGQRPTEGTEEQ